MTDWTSIQAITLGLGVVACSAVVGVTIAIGQWLYGIWKGRS